MQKGTPIFLFSAVTLEKFAKLSISASNPLHMQGRNYGGDPGETPVTPKFWGTIAIIISIRTYRHFSQLRKSRDYAPDTYHTTYLLFHFSTVQSTKTINCGWNVQRMSKNCEAFFLWNHQKWKRSAEICMYVLLFLTISSQEITFSNFSCMFLTFLNNFGNKIPFVYNVFVCVCLTIFQLFRMN